MPMVETRSRSNLSQAPLAANDEWQFDREPDQSRSAKRENMEALPSMTNSSSSVQLLEQHPRGLAHQSVSKDGLSLKAQNGGGDVPAGEYPDDEVDKSNSLSLTAAEHGSPPPDRSLESIGKLSLPLDSDGPQQGCVAGTTIARQELTLSPIPFPARSSLGESVHLPESTEDTFVLEAASESFESSQLVVRQSILVDEASAAEGQKPVASTEAMSTPSKPICVRVATESLDHHECDGGDDVNNSVASKGSVASRGSSLGELEMERMTEELGASSMEFIRRIRAAAFRRKLDVTRSRDSLAAKELERKKAIAESWVAEQKRSRRMTEPLVPATALVSAASQQAARPPRRSSVEFHARPLPKTTGPKGGGGMSGVPTVVKKPTTVPHSPLLGSRRRGRSRQRQALPKDGVPPQRTLSDDDGEDSSRSPSPTRDQNIFRALPLPKASTDLGQGGMSGVPKIAKRPTTVPRSPLLGFRRHPDASSKPPREARAGAATHGISTVKKRQTTVPRSPLLGLRRFAKQSQESSEASTADPLAATPALQQKLKQQQSSRRSLTSSLSTSSSVTPLVGLHLVESGSKIECPASSRGYEPARLQVVNDVQHRSDPQCTAGAAPRAHSHDDRDEYRPHSTTRAAQRAQFQVKRAELERERQEALSQDRRQQVQALKREMKGLRASLSQWPRV